jgi:hypothetical protein
MARKRTLQRVDFARRGAEIWAILVAEIPTSGLTAKEAGDLIEARDLLCASAKALRRLMSRSMPSPAGKGSPGGP